MLEQGLLQVDGCVQGPIIDLGCAVGRTSFELAALDEIVLGVDLNFSMLRLAGSVLKEGRVRYQKRRLGLVYETRSFPAPFGNSHRVDFWACDATCLPFASGTFNFGACINLLDCVHSPYDHLKELARLLKPHGQAILSTPYDWNVNATPTAAWIGGHSQRSTHQGASDAVLRSLMAGGGHPAAIAALRCRSEKAAVPWRLRLHDRCAMTYAVHLMVLERVAGV